MSETPRHRTSSSAPAPAKAADDVVSAETIVRSIGGLAARLSELMIKETALIKAGRSREIAALQPVKVDLARAYAGRWALLKARPDETAKLPASLVEALRIQLAKMTAATAENEKALRMVQRATDRVLAIIARAVREQRSATTGYTKRNLPSQRSPGILGVALDRRY